MLTLCYIHTVLEFGSFEIVALGLKRKIQYNNYTARHDIERQKTEL